MEDFSEHTSKGKSFTLPVSNYALVTPLPAHRNTAFSDDLVHYTSIINVVGICTIISLFGIFSNIVNMIIFQRLGFQETVNITLFATAISDLLSLTTTLWMAICYNPLFLSADLPFLPLEIQLPTGELPHVMAMNATSWLTAYVTLERCICITFPLKVKDIITPKRTKFIIVFIFIMVVSLQIPTYITARMAMKFDYGMNKSLLGLVIQEEYVMVNAVSIYIVNVMGPFLSFSITVICSVVLVTRLYQKSKWRQQSMIATGIGKDNSLGKKDRKVMKMILIVAVVFMACNTPGMLIFIMTAENPEMTPAGSLANNYYVAVSFALVFEAVNASVNICVYYNMSSRYKDIFGYIFLRQPANTD